MEMRLKANLKSREEGSGNILKSILNTFVRKGNLNFPCEPYFAAISPEVIHTGGGVTSFECPLSQLPLTMMDEVSILTTNPVKGRSSIP
ncbi:hypothetical protein JTE90_003964 [Oedothorax gibbosus]|uniref:Uncharacterized protein n=1 Tax=Oedothorax gibbosus TaxID=931172 RepID=A0AAV6UYA9_9ARAC|nr:hypothetical protein JTE90_003964 [Oedothorax gibbosus]